MGDVEIIYIAGYGRSGSTLLSVMLDSIPSVVAVGELAGLSKFSAAGAPICSCGEEYSRCEVWGAVLERVPGGRKGLAELGRIRRRMEGWNGRLIGWHRRRVREKYKRLTRGLFSAIVEVTAANVIVDASKSAFPSMWRGQRLGEVVHSDLFVIHLIRKPSQVMSSCRKGRNVDLERNRRGRSGLLGAGMGLGGWCAANLAARSVRRSYGPEQSTIVRFEDLVKSPLDELRRICVVANLGVSLRMMSGHDDAVFEVGHLVGANRMARNNDTIQVRQERSLGDPAGYLEKAVASTLDPHLLRIMGCE